MNKSYSEMLQYKTYEERLAYLKLEGKVGEETFGPYRNLYQSFLKSKEWKMTCDLIKVRDNYCIMGLKDFDISDHRHIRMIVHHINPITLYDLLFNREKLFDPENLILLTKKEHDYIHYGTEYDYGVLDRKEGDTCPWKKKS